MQIWTLSLNNMLTPEQKAKLKAAGYSDTKINVFEAQKAMSQPEIQPEKDSLLKTIAKGVVKPFAKLGTSLVNLGEFAIGSEPTQPFSGKFLGEVKPIGAGFDTSKGLTKENIGALKDSIKTGVDIGSWFGGGTGTVGAVKTGIKEGIIQGAKTGAKLGATTGALGGASTGLEEGATVGGTLKNIAAGSVVGGVAGGVLGGAPGVVKGIAQGTKKLASKTSQVAGKATEGKLPKLLSIFTGEGNDVIKSALDNPQVADIGIKGGDEALRKAVQTGATSSIKARSAFSKAYNDSFTNLVKKNPNKLVSRQKILYSFVDDLEKAGVKVKNGELDFSTSLINANPGEASKIKNAYEALQNWDDWSLEGTNLYKQLIGKLTKFPTEAGGTSKSPFLGKFYNSIDNEIKLNLPKNQAKLYSEMNKKFSENIDMYDEMVDAFNSGDPFTKLAQIFGKNKDTLRQVVDFYEKTTGNKISPIVAGRTLAEEKPAAFGFLNPRQWIDFFVPPKTQAQLVTKIGKAKQAVKKPNK